MDLVGSCEGQKLDGRQIGNVSVRTPFDALHLGFVRNLEDSQKQALAIKPNKTYSDAIVDKSISQLEALELSPPANLGSPVSGSVVAVRASNCLPKNGHDMVDLEFYFIPARIPAFWSYSFESRAEETTDPAHPAGVAPRRYWVTPTAGYSQSARLFGGLSSRFELPSKGIDSLTVEGSTSTQIRSLNIALGGSYDAGRTWLKHGDFSGGLQYRDEPAGPNRLQAAQAFLEWKGATNALGPLGLVIRYGTAFEAGNRHGYVAGPTEGIAVDSPFGGLKGFGGVTLRTAHHSLAASYGILAARTGNGGLVDFRKHLLDVAHSWSWVHNHYPLEIDSRLSAGRIENLCGGHGSCVPLAERFFGGNVERNFLGDGSWVIRNAPLLRSLPLNGLNTANAGVGGGGDRYWAVNLTAAVGVARKTLIPEDLLNQPSFLDRIDATTRTATALLASAYANLDKDFDKDPGLENARSLLPAIRSEMSVVQPAWDALAPLIQPGRADDYDQCGDDHLTQVPLDLDDVEARVKPITLLSNASGNLAETVKCLRKFSPASGDPLSASAQRLETLRQNIVAAVEKTGTYQRAKSQADKDMALANRTIQTLFHETNLISFSPVFVFDAGAIGPPVLGRPALRYGVGGGGRFTFVSTVRFTVGYAANIGRQPGEGRGALFASLEVLDIFGR